MALGHIRKLYAIERRIKDLRDAERHRLRQAQRLPQLEAFKAWLFADTSQGAKASATCYSLIETAKANALEPSAYLHHVLKHIAEADTVETLEALLPWNVGLEPASKTVAQYR